MLALGDGWARLWNCALPVLAQVQGNCLAGGTDLALHCDLVIAAEDATIGFPPVRSMGVPPTNMWLYHLGPQWTKRLVLTGDTLTGAQACDVGLVVATAPADALDGVVLELAQRMALIGRDLLVANKRVVNMGVSGDTTTDGVNRLSEVVAEKPRIVIVEFGGSDGLRGLPIETTRANLEEILSTI